MEHKKPTNAIEIKAKAAVMLLLLMMIPFQVGAEIIRVTGKVVAKGSNKPLMGVNIVLQGENRLMATTDADGRFAFDTREHATLRFSLVGANPVTVKVKGRTYIEVEMEEKSKDLEEIMVTAKRLVDKAAPEATDIEVKGNMLTVRTRVRVPRGMFHKNCRLVIQPILNNVSTGDSFLMKPLVYDATEYNRTQRRMYDFDLTQDPLANYITVKTDSLREKENHRNDIIGYSDSIYVPNVKHSFSCDVYQAMEDYRRIIYRDTTTIARGTVNPLRFLSYKFAPARILTDSALYPKAELQLRDSKGNINLRFPVGKSSIDLTDSLNATEVGRLNEQLLSIARNRDSRIRAFTISGTASPEGFYKKNLQLANERMQTALNLIVSRLDEDTRKGMEVRSHATVESWETVAQLMRHDSLNQEADEVEYIVKRYRHMDEQGRHIRKLPFYNDIIKNRYLPRLRHVEYLLSYTIYRQLTVNEIRALYAKDYRQLSRFEFFRLYRGETDSVKRETICRQALEVYPSFMIAANDLSAELTNSGKSDAEILLPFAGKNAPTTLNRNQVIALLNTGNYSAADTLLPYLPDDEECRTVKAFASAFNGNYAENYETIAATSPLNDVLMLLAMKRNKEAADKALLLPSEEALTHYVRAICLNRLEKPGEAIEELRQSFKMDPSLEKIARIDGDVNDLILKNK